MGCSAGAKWGRGTWQGSAGTWKITIASFHMGCSTCHSLIHMPSPTPRGRVDVWVPIGPHSLVCVPQPREDQWTLDEFRNLHSAIAAA